jgi:predicted neutral ceramidase superfamily lipid hydrolase
MLQNKLILYAFYFLLAIMSGCILYKFLHGIIPNEYTFFISVLSGVYVGLLSSKIIQKIKKSE